MIPSILDQAQQKRRQINAWLGTAIGLQEARDRGLIQLSGTTALRNWTCREALFDFARMASQADPVLVRLDERRGALFTLPKPRAGR